MNYSVYKHVCPNGKVYIGITGKSTEERWRNGKGYLNNQYFTSAIKKYGWDKIDHIIIANNLDYKTACNLEQKLIKEHKSNNREYGYNHSIGGDAPSLGYKHSEEAKIKIAKASKNRKLSAEAICKIREREIKSVKVYNINGEFIKEFESLTEAEKYTGVSNSNISATCKGRYKQFKGYIFRYADDTTPVNPVRSHRKPVLMMSITGEPIKQFNSIREAARALNISDTHIGDCCKGKYENSGGYKWQYI